MSAVLVLGRGKTGDAVARYLEETATPFTVVDDADHPDWTSSEVDTLLDAHDLVVPSPGVPERHPILAAAIARGIAIRSEIDLAAGLATMPIVAVTGTNGKTTVTTLITAMLEHSGVRAAAAGNIGAPLIDAIHSDADVLVTEVSSFQLRFTPTFRPRVAVWTNVADDHLDWHGSFEAYARSKANVFAHQRADDVLVTDADDPVLAAYTADAVSRRVEISLDPARTTAWRVRDGAVVDPDGTPIVGLDDLDVVAPHELRNVLIAAAAVRAMGGDDVGIAAGARATRRLHHRVELVGQAGGVQWINDSKATNPHATLAAARAFDSVVLIAGGKNKGLDLGVLREIAPRLRHVVAIGDAAPEVAAAFDGLTSVTVAPTMAAAVGAAGAVAEPGDVVLLSPACASFDWYSGYPARGDDFRSEVDIYLAAQAELA